MTKTPHVGDPPPHGVSAVIHLMRLANANESDNTVRSGVLHLARQLNSELDEQTQILLIRDSRCREPFHGATPEEIVDASYIAIGTYRVSPEMDALRSNRIAAYLMLERYFVWCRALFNEMARYGDEDVQAERSDQAEMPDPFTAPAYKTGALLGHWLVALCPVIEGWEELKMADGEIDQLLHEGSETGHRTRLFRFRHGIVHYQRTHDDPRFTDFMNSGSEANLWAVKLERSFARVFEHHVKTDHADLSEWLHR